MLSQIGEKKRERSAGIASQFSSSRISHSSMSQNESVLNDPGVNNEFFVGIKST